MGDGAPAALDRSAAIERLTRHAAAGELTLDEYAACAAAIEAASDPRRLDRPAPESSGVSSGSSASLA